MKISLFLLATSLTQAAPPNILFIAADDLRNDLGCYGESHMVTPHIDALAGQGRVFRNHYVAVPTCGASRYALMTGLRPTSSTDGNNAFDQMPSSPGADPESWVELLKRNGWHTASIGKITHEPDGFRWSFPSNYDDNRFRGNEPDMRFSFDEIIYDHDKWGARRYPLFAYADGTGRVRGTTSAYEVGIDAEGNSLPDDAYPDGQMAQAAIEKLREFSDDNTRFCLTLGFHNPHLPFNAPKAYWDLYDPATLPPAFPESAPTGATPGTVTNSGEINAYTNRNDRARLRHAYYASISYVDAQVGKVLDELEALGLADNTIVVLWGDHGWCFDDYGTIGKHKVLERSLESPLIIRPPASQSSEVFAGIPATGVVETIDIYPTIAELCGLTPPSSAAGSSLVPMLRNPFAPGKTHAFSRFGSLTSIRTSDWRLINSSGTFDLYDLSSIRYELEDVSSQEPQNLATLSALINTQGQREGRDYGTFAAGNPLLADPGADSDQDGSSNRLEYLSGTNPLNASSKPAPTLTTADLSHLGHSQNELLYTFTVASDTNDGTLLPQSSINLADWNSTPLEFVDSIPLANSHVQLRFRISGPTAPRRFFRQEISGN